MTQPHLMFPSVNNFIFSIVSEVGKLSKCVHFRAVACISVQSQF